MKYGRAFFFVAAALTSLSASILIRPKLESYSVEELHRRRPLISRAIQFGAPAKTPARAPFQYRGDETRLGQINELKGPIEALRRSWVATPLNFDLHGAAKASPAVDETGIYVGADTGRFQKYDFDGHVIWSFVAHTLTRGIHATATLTEDTVYFGAYDGWFYALDKTTGAPRWSIALGRAIGASALIWKNDLYITVETERDGFIAKLNPANGDVCWVSEFLGEQAHSSVTIDEASGLAIVGSNARNVVAIQLADGAQKWVFHTPLENKGTGALFEGRYIFGSTDGVIYALEAASGQLVWKTPVGGRILGNLSVDPKRRLGFISSTQGVFGLSLADGKKQWDWIYDKVGLPRGMGAQTPLLIQHGRDTEVLAECARRLLCTFVETTGQIVRKFPLAGTYSGTPTIFNGQIYLAHLNEGLESLAINSAATTKLSDGSRSGSKREW